MSAGRLQVIAAHLRDGLSCSPSRSSQVGPIPRPASGTSIATRQRVIALLSEAQALNSSPWPTSSSTLEAPASTTTQQVAKLLLQAYGLEPYRSDLLISAANALVHDGELSRAIALLGDALSNMPDDLDTNSYLAIWSLVAGTEEAASRYLAKVRDLNQGRANDMSRIINCVQRVTTAPLMIESQKIAKGRRALVTLGYALRHDGSMDDILVARLRTTLSLAAADPSALVVVTGGVERNGQTEASAMSQWLIEHGVREDRVVEDNYAKNTVENALYSAQILAALRVDVVTVVSSARHVRRGQVLLEVAFSMRGPPHVEFDSVCCLDGGDASLDDVARVSQEELLHIYRDALRVYGLWMFRSPPLLEH
mmetsp:Transcript_77963/g.252909  ORF Transcript_77963/g.252909 Transcript_77963/m.252909 type:complete len:367 (-) Transcript_77963:70-1170(-)